MVQDPKPCNASNIAIPAMRKDSAESYSIMGALPGKTPFAYTYIHTYIHVHTYIHIYIHTGWSKKLKISTVKSISVIVYE